MDLSRQLQEALAKESLIQKSKAVQSKVTTEQLKTMTEHFRYAKTASSYHVIFLFFFKFLTLYCTSKCPRA